MPPVHHVAFLELALGGVENLAAGNARVYRQQGQHILKLVAETECPAGLVKGRPAPDATGEALVEHPAVEDQVGGGLWSMYLDLIEQLIPEGAGTFQGSPHISRAMVLLGQGKGLFLVNPLPEHEIDLFHRAGEQIQVHLQYGAGILSGRNPRFETDAAQSSREGGCSTAPKELGPVGGQAVDCFAGNQECDSLAKFGAVGVGSQ